MMKGYLSTFGEYTGSLENNAYEHYVFDYFMKKTIDNANFDLVTNDYIITDDDKFKQYNEISGGNIRVYLLTERKLFKPTTIMIIYNHLPVFTHTPKTILEYMREIYPLYKNILFMAHTLTTPGGLCKYEGTQVIKEPDNSMCRIIIKEAEDFSMLDINEFISVDGCC